VSSQTDIRVTYEKTDIYETLVDDYSIFGSYVDFFVFAGCLGFAKDRKKQEPSGDNEMLWMHVGNKDLYRAVAASLAYQDTNDPNSLIDPETQLEALNKYAAGGAEIAAREFGDISGDPTDAVLSYIQANHDPTTQSEQESIMDNIMSSFDSDMLDTES
jgi:dnd system-associated protein 4